MLGSTVAVSPAEIRATLLDLTREFVLAASSTPGVLRIAMLGSLLTTKPRPKDADVLVTIADDQPGRARQAGSSPQGQCAREAQLRRRCLSRQPVGAVRRAYLSLSPV